MGFNFSALKIQEPETDADLSAISMGGAIFIVARALNIEVHKTRLLLENNFPNQNWFRPGDIGNLIRAYYVDEKSPWNSVPSGDPDEHDGE